MLFRFSLYGVLKNQRYFEAFLLLALLHRGLSFAQIGLLIAVRELTHGVLEVPSGVAADLLGRRRVMVAAAASYVVAYPVLGASTSVGWLGLGMALVGFGDAFRSGTHKAMIFDWLSAQGRQDERVRVYGLTRSWSQLGSALAVPLAATIVIVFDDPALVFWVSTIPAALNLLNLATYPSALQGPRRAEASLREAMRALWQGLRELWPQRPVRRLLLEATTMGGVHRSAKDYLQPLLEAVALSLPWLWGTSDFTRTAVLVGGVYTGLFLLSAVAARQAHRVVERLGDPARASRRLWWCVVATFAAMLAGFGLGIGALAIAGFVALALLHNIFRPVLVGRFDEHTPAALGATVLSLESQAVSLAAVVLAPAIGLALDHIPATSISIERLWPVAAVGMVLALVVAVSARVTPAASR